MFFQLPENESVHFTLMDTFGYAYKIAIVHVIKFHN